MENISFNSTVFLEFLGYILDCTQSVKVLSELEFEKLVTIFLLVCVCSWSIYRAIRGLVLFFQIEIRGK